MMRFHWNQTRSISLLGSLLIIPWACFMNLGFTFTFREHESVWTWIFVWFAFRLNIPAVLVSWFAPRLSAYWMILNAAISMAVGAVFEFRSYLESPHTSGPYLPIFLNAFAGAVFLVVFFWFIPCSFALGMLMVLKANKLQAAA